MLIAYLRYTYIGTFDNTEISMLKWDTLIDIY